MKSHTEQRTGHTSPTHLTWWWRFCGSTSWHLENSLYLAFTSSCSSPSLQCLKQVWGLVHEVSSQMFCWRQANTWKSHRRAQLFSLEEVICEENQHDLPQPSYCSLAACPLWHHTMGSRSVKYPPRCLEALQESPHTSGHSKSGLGHQGGPTARRGGLTSQGPAPQYPRRDSPAVAKPS